ncbi:MAG: phosphopantetheine-binding protein [Clostridia bacterium]|nr:phosphopantetheine-binding protein [Clostridia bacterium]
MSDKNLKELVNQLSEDQRQLLYDRVARVDNSREPQNINMPRQYDIAIIGLSGRYPQAGNHLEFWHKLQQGFNFIEEVPRNRWDHNEYYEPDSRDDSRNKTRCKYGAFINEHDKFDAEFFNIHSREAALMDPQERLALETTWSCIEDAGYEPSMLSRETGVFTGLTYSEFQKLIPMTTHSYVLGSRIAYFFDFKAMSVTTDAGCCSSLNAIHLACQSLIRGECRTAIVVGANLILHPEHYTTASQMLSSKQIPLSSPFGIDDGWIPAEGIVAVLLKPLKKAVADKDNIYGIIKSSHILQDGKTSWFTAFNPKQQAKLIQENFIKSGIDPQTIGYVEAAANGSDLGDAIEIEGLNAAFKNFTDKTHYCPIGSVKSNTGHGEAVSTLLQLTKVLLQFKSKTLLPLVNITEINPNINMEQSPFYLLKESQRWEPPVVRLNEEQFSLPRRATISSFGAGGNIGHLILEEYSTKESEKQTLDYYIIPVSARSVDLLRLNLENYLDFFEEYLVIDAEWQSNYTLLNMMFTLCAGRVSFQERVVFVADRLESLVTQIRQFLGGNHNSNIITEGSGSTAAPAADNIDAANYLKNHSLYDLARVWVCGGKISWDGFFKQYDVKRVSLPVSAFEKKHFPVPSIPKPVKYTSSPKTGVNPGPVVEKLQNRENGTDLRQIVREIFAKALSIPVHQVNLASQLDEYGFDSIMVAKVADGLGKYYGTVPKTLFFECQTINDVINHLGQRYTAESLKTVPEDDSIESLTKAILSDGISAEILINKLP